MPTGAPPLNFNQAAPGWNTGPSMADTGRYNAMSSHPMPGPGFWPSIGGTLRNAGGSILNTLGRGIGVLSNFGGQNSSSVTPSAGGWAIDKDGNLVSTSSATGAPAGSTNQTRSGPSPISHVISVPGLASLFMGNEARRNLI